MSLLMDALRKAERARKEMAEAGVEPNAARSEDTAAAAMDQIQTTPAAAPAGDVAGHGLEVRARLSLAPLDESLLDQPLAVEASPVSAPRSSSPAQDAAPLATPLAPAPEDAAAAARRPQSEGRAADARPAPYAARSPERPAQAPAIGTTRPPSPGTPEAAASRTRANAVFQSKRTVAPRRSSATRVMVLSGVLLLLMVVGAGGYLHLMDDGGGLVPQVQVAYQPPPLDEPPPQDSTADSVERVAAPQAAGGVDTKSEPQSVTFALRLTPESAVPASEELPVRVAPPETIPARAPATPPDEPFATSMPAAQAQAPAPAPAVVASEPVRLVRSVSPNKVDGVVRAAWESFMQGDLARAREGYQAALAQDHLNRDGLLGLAAVEAAEGNPSAALGHYRRLLERDPRDPAALEGMMALGAGSVPDEQALRKLSGTGKSGTASFALGNLYAAQGRWADAQEAYFDAYSHMKDNADYAFNIAISLEHLGQRQPALNYYRRAVELARQRPHGFDPAQAQTRIEALLARGGDGHGR